MLLFSAKNSYEDANWLKSDDIHEKSAHIQYIYAFYFACSTMLTVGYGDMAPSN